MIEGAEEAGGDACGVEPQHEKIADRAKQVAVTPVLGRRRDRGGGDRPESVSPDAPDNIDILHQGQPLVAAELFVERSADEQALIAIRQSQQATAKAHDPFDEPGGARRVIESEAEVSRVKSIHWIGYERPHGLRPAGLRLGVRVQEKKPIAGRRRGAGRKLVAPPALSLEEDSTAAYGDKRGIGDRAGVGDDNLMR